MAAPDKDDFEQQINLLIPGNRKDALERVQDKAERARARLADPALRAEHYKAKFRRLHLKFREYRQELMASSCGDFTDISSDEEDLLIE